MILTGLFAILCWFLILPVLYMLGSLAVRKLDDGSPVLHGIYVGTFGLAFLSYFLVAFGSVGLLKPVHLLIGVGVVTIFCWRYLKGLILWLDEVARFIVLPVPSAFERIAQLFLWGTLAVTVVLCFLPEIAHDALCYHLNLPKWFIRHASVLPLEYDLKSYHSQLMDVLYSVGLFLRNVSIAKLFHWFAGFLTAMLLMVIIDKETQRRGLALFFGLMLWLTPTFLNQVTVTYSDVGVTLFVLAGFSLFLQGLYGARSLRHFFLAGLMLGFAVSCKYSAVMFAVPMGGWLVIHLLHEPKAERSFLARALGLFSLGALLGCIYWFLRAFFSTGDPFFPYLTAKFGGAGLYSEINYAKSGVPRNLVSFLLLPFSIVFSPDIFERHSWAGPFFLLLIPLMVWGAIRDVKARFSVFVSFVSVVLWFFLAQNIRFLLPVFPLMLFSAAFGVAKLPSSFLKPGLKRLGWGVAFLAMLFLSGIGFYHYRVHLLALGQGWDSGKFLTQLERTYPVAQWVNRNLPKDARVFSTEVRQFYFDREMIIDNITFYHPKEDFAKLTPAEFRDQLKRLGVTHVMQVLPMDKTIKSLDLNRRNLDALLHDASMASFVADIPSQNIREDQYRYLIYKLL